nr:HTH-type transcriptional activator RhaS [uncultured bacterium]
MRSERGGLTIERHIRRVGPGMVGLRQRFAGDGERCIVTHEASLVSRVEVRAGSITFGDHVAPERFVLSVPPRSVVRMRFHAAAADSDGMGKIGTLSPGPPQLREADDLLRSDTLAVLDLDALAPAPLVRARRALHEHLSELAPVRAAAEDAQLDAEALTRAFRRAYGLTPKHYCNRARLFDAAIALLSGASVATAAFSSGFNDLSRFYAQFRRLLRATPGDYAKAAGNRQDPR